MSLADCAMAPIIWRLQSLDVPLPKDGKAIEDYGNRIFRPPGFVRSLPEQEKTLRDLPPPPVPAAGAGGMDQRQPADPAHPGRRRRPRRAGPAFGGQGWPGGAQHRRTCRRAVDDRQRDGELLGALLRHQLSGTGAEQRRAGRLRPRDRAGHGAAGRHPWQRDRADQR
ncbi:hypothetical protein G6F59_015763 [Rhizopus arrhizus]|nr:hypothetical protein G6F59_015763 [Rhizopus arrhizus]